MSKRRSKLNPQSRPQSKTAAPSKTRAWLFVFGGLFLVALAVGAIAFIQPPAAPALSTAPAEISVAEAADKYEAGVFFLDVRTQEEWNEVHIPDTTLIPLDELKTRLNELPRGVEIVVVCRSGNRSQEGRDILSDAGFGPVSSMAGGVRDWSAQGLPTTSGS